MFVLYRDTLKRDKHIVVHIWINDSSLNLIQPKKRSKLHEHFKKLEFCVNTFKRKK